MNCLEFINFCKSTPSEKKSSYKNGIIGSLLVANADEDHITYQQLYRLRFCLLVKQYLEYDKDAELAARIIDFVNSEIGAGSEKRYLPFSHKNWAQAVRIIKAKVKSHNGITSIFMPQEAKAQQYALAIKRLTVHGLTYRFEEDHIVFDGEKAILKQCSDSVKHLGGLVFLNEMFESLDYKGQRHRFGLPVQGTVSFATRRMVEFPFNYMLNLGLLHIKHDGVKAADPKAETQRIMMMCRDICFVLYPVQAWDIWEDIFHTGRGALEYLKDIVLRKSIYGLEQASPLYIEELCKFVVDYHNSHPGLFRIPNDFTLDDFLTLMKWCMANADERQIKRIRKERIHLRFKRRVLDGLLSSLCIRESQLNKGFLYPSDYLCVNYWPYPLIIDNHDILTMMPKPIMAWWWLEALMAIIRNANGNFESEMGTIVECFLKHKMTHQGIHHVCGEYKQPVTGECDHVIVASDRLIFIEDKKKPLTRSAYSGNTDDIIIDLAKSLVISQEQCHGHAVDLLKNKGLAMTEKATGVNYTLDDSIKDFDYISLSLSDYGPLQCRILLPRVMELFLKSSFDVDVTAYPNAIEAMRYKKEIGKINRCLDELRKHIQYLASLNPSIPYHTFFDSWFITLEQMVFLLNQSHSSDEFYSNLQKVKFCSHGVYDYYEEWDLMNPILQP